MDWPLSPECSLLLSSSPSPALYGSHSVRGSPIFRRALVETNNQDVEMGDASPTSSLSPSFPDTTLVIDTNVFLNHLPTIETIAKVIHLHSISIKLVIPGIVITELDGLKMTSDVGFFARGASAWIIKQLKSDKKIVRVQAFDETVKPLGNWKNREQGEKNDDMILDCCSYYSLKQRTFLCSSDNNLCVQSEANGIKTVIPPASARSKWTSHAFFSLFDLSNVLKDVSCGNNFPGETCHSPSSPEPDLQQKRNHHHRTKLLTSSPGDAAFQTARATRKPIEAPRKLTTPKKEANPTPSTRKRIRSSKKENYSPISKRESPSRPRLHKSSTPAVRMNVEHFPSDDFFGRASRCDDDQDKMDIDIRPGSAPSVDAVRERALKSFRYLFDCLASRVFHQDRRIDLPKCATTELIAELARLQHLSQVDFGFAQLFFNEESPFTSVTFGNGAADAWETAFRQVYKMGMLYRDTAIVKEVEKFEGDFVQLFERRLGFLRQ